MTIIGADIGNDYTKIVYDGGKDIFPSCIAHAVHLNLMNKLKNDMIVEFEGKKYFIGELAVREAQLPIEPRGLTKVRNWTLIRLLTALAKNGIATASVVINQPITGINKESVKAMTKLLKGEHKITLNGLEHKIKIEHVLLVPEGAAAYHSLTQKPRSCRIVDLGSGTINVATVVNGVFINKESFTKNYGVKSGEMTLKQIVEFLYEETYAIWKGGCNDLIVVGGVAAEFTKVIQDYIEEKSLQLYSAQTAPDAQFANAHGAYNIGVAKYAHC